MDKTLGKIIIESSLTNNLTERKFGQIKRKHMRSLGIHGLPSYDDCSLPAGRQALLSVRGLPSNMNLLSAYHRLVKEKKIKPSQELEQIIKKRKVRTLSGIASITVLTKNWGCPGRCVFCPTERGMPKSYLSNEPAVMRAVLTEFDPYRQVGVRLDSLKKQGHSTDKIEIIVIGGTWSAIPHDYQEWYIKRLYDALNGKDSKTLEAAQKKNETAKQKLVGLTLETRPDWVTEEEIKRMRRFGCTRVELGVQSIYDDVLLASKRGHKIDATIKAVKILKDAGFKINFHMMPNLPKSTPQRDIKMFKEIFANPDFRPDLLKIYPCVVVENAELYKDFKAGKYKPYTDKQLMKIIKEAKSHIPEYCRVVRVIRDIPATSIVGGSKISNLREYIQQAMAKEGKFCRCIRCREVKDAKLEAKNLKLKRMDYDSSGGKEIFLTFDDIKNDKLVALLRLRIPPQKEHPTFPVLSNSAIIREVHTYGNLAPISQKLKTAQQHRGLGKKLLKEAEKIAKKEFRLKKIAVISAVGVRGYYAKLGYKLRDTYMVKDL